MGFKATRTIEAAFIEGIGPITADELLSLPEDRWGIWRDRITDYRNSGDGIVARCMRCNSPVYISTRKNRPLFQHYNDSDPFCPWYQGRNIHPNNARAAQYQGQQESNFHRKMCEQIGELVQLDERYVRHTIDEYLPPTENEYGRFPDTYVEWKGFGAFAVEFQMSSTFQTEISQRCKHYEREGIPLLWVLFGIDPTGRVQQSFNDVIRRHRGNAFVLDQAAIEESKREKTLVLTCLLRNGESFTAPKLVRFDTLTIPRSKIPYYEDRITTPLLSKIKEARRPWFEALENWDRNALLCGLERPASLLVAAAFSIVATANGKERNYASLHPNIRGMLNTYLHGEIFSPYSDLLTRLIKNTAVFELLDGKVGEHLKRHAGKEQLHEDSSEIRLLKELLPEALNPIIRNELRYLDALPKWAERETLKK